MVLNKRGENKTGCNIGINFGTHFFLIFLNDLPNIASIGTKSLLYADDTSIIVTSPNLISFETKIYKLFADITN
jgi:hypothetical protein